MQRFANKTLIPLAIALLLGATPALASPPAPVDIDAFIRKDVFNDIEISPDGLYFAATVPREDRTVLVILRRSDNKVTFSLDDGKNTHVSDFVWVANDRLIVTMARKFGSLDQPAGTGELYGVDVDGRHAGVLVGGSAKVQNKRQPQSVFASMIDDLPKDAENILISTDSYHAVAGTQAERMNIRTGRRIMVARSPVPGGFATDNNGEVRFAMGTTPDRKMKLYYRADRDAEWVLVSDEDKTGLVQYAVGFSPDNATAYLQTESKTGPDAILAYDVATGQSKEIMRDDAVDPAGYLTNADGAVIGVTFYDGKRRTAFFDEMSADAKLQRSLEKAFPGKAVNITSRTSDGKQLLVAAWGDRSMGDFYIFDRATGQAQHVATRGSWHDPAQLAAMEPIEVTARDGMKLHGYLTMPAGSTGKNLPLIIHPHGGPFTIQDTWGYDSRVQMLAKAGYAVLQLNFRGSSGYGRAYAHAGARQWGLAMQDDLTDATHWAIKQGIADPSRICIYGASYGAYASLMGVAKEPDLYKCAVGYVGVYDMPLMQKETKEEGGKRLDAWSLEWVGEGDILAKTSPNRIADKIKVPVFLAAGGEDRIAPIEHTKKMEKALQAADVPVESLYFETEGHGFYTQEHQREYYTRLLAFLSRHLGGATAAPAGSGKPAK